VIPYTWRISNKLPLGYQQNEMNKPDEKYPQKKRGGGEKTVDKINKTAYTRIKKNGLSSNTG